jgi:signal transduction histidine kinase
MKTITSRFAMWLATAAVVPLLVYGIVSIYWLRAGTERSVINGNLAVARRAAEQITLYISTNVKILETLAGTLDNTNLDPRQKDRILKNYVLNFPEFREITLFDAHGAWQATSRVGRPKITLPAGPPGLDGAATMSPIALDDDGLPTTVIGVPITRGAEPIGWLAGETNLEELWRMVDRIRVGERGFALIVGPAGQLIAHGDPDQKALVAQNEDFGSHPLVQAAQNPGGAPLFREVDRRGQAMLSVAAPAGPHRWTVIVEQPLTEAYALSTRLQRQLVVAIGAALLVTALAGYYFGRQFIQPIFALIRGTRAVSAGRLDERVYIGGEDEFHQLGEAFNSMAESIVRLQDDVRKQERHAMFGRIAAGLVHDLSTPLQNIGNSCKLILRMGDDQEYRASFRRTIDREFDILKRVLDDLRNVAKPMPIERHPLDLNRAVAEIAESMRTQAEAVGLTLKANLAPEPVYIEGDAFALARVYRNLLSNAIQATPPGGRVSIETARVASTAEVRVRDSGCGIEPERLGEIFEDFMTTKKRGLGLGLAITKRIVEQLGGTIQVASELGHGTTFVLRFAALPAETQEPVRQASA